MQGHRSTPTLADSVRTASIYVHFPYCLEKCPYCDFVSYKTAREAIDHRAYADAVLREADGRAELMRDRRVGSIFFGGGTPSLWAPEELGRVLDGLRARFGGDSCEVTVECNPTSLDGERAAALARARVNRLSIGVQSLRSDALRFLGRLHDVSGAVTAVRAALASPISRVSADLIFGLPGQSPEDAAKQAGELADLGLRHLSCYQLTIEPKTRFGELAKRGKLPLALDGAVADAFLAIDEVLTSRGFQHYEISNYAQPREEAQHNLGYWRGEEYLGLGCGAFGFTRNAGGGGVRWRNQVLPEVYVANAHEPTMEREELDGETLLRERIMLGLRLEGGLDLAAAGDDLGLDALTAARRRDMDALAARERLCVAGARMWIPRAARLFTDDIAARLF
jgi:putative oxygen-independent coproporphyrinogen III oxidase